MAKTKKKKEEKKGIVKKAVSAVTGAYATGKEKMGLVGDLIEDQVITEGMDRLSRGALETLTTGGGVTGGQMWKKAVGQMGSGSADALLELGRGTHIAMTDTADRRKEALSRGEELVEKPWWYQAVNLKLNTADAMNEYGKVKEKRESEWFKENILNGPEGDVAREWEARGNREVEEGKEEDRVLAYDLGVKNRENDLKDLQEALDPDYDLEGRTLGLVRKITRKEEEEAPVSDSFTDDGDNLEEQTRFKIKQILGNG